jgi:hypothetical protein
LTPVNERQSLRICGLSKFRSHVASKVLLRPHRKPPPQNLQTSTNRPKSQNISGEKLRTSATLMHDATNAAEITPRRSTYPLLSRFGDDSANSYNIFQLWSVYRD